MTRDPSVPILEVRNLIKHYPKVQAVNGVSLSIRPGVCFGLLGPNGAGKTTTIEMIEGITRPTSGEILFRGKPVGEEFRQKSGIQFQETSIQDYMKVREVLRMFRSFYRDAADVGELQKICALEDFLDRDVHSLSGGQRQRVLLAVALVNNPDIVFLDEPTTGLDPQARRNFWDLIRKIKSQNKTVVLTTHYMEEAYALCDEIAIMDRGRIIAQGQPDHLLKQYFEGVFVQLPEEDLRAATATLDLPGRRYDRQGVIEIQTSEVNVVLKRLLEAGVPLARLRVRSQTLEDLFLELTGRELRA